MTKNSIITWVHNNIECQPYDYTKILSSRISTPEYHLTYSLSEKNYDKCRFILKNKIGNIAVVFNLQKKDIFPETFMGGFPVLNGDLSDLRFKDSQPGYIVGLRSKGDALRNKNGFSIYKGSKYLDSPSDNNLLKDPDVDTKPRILKFKDYTSTISFSKKDVERQLNEYLRSERPLLSTSNPKLEKGARYNYTTYGLSLAPAKTNGFMNLCSHATPGCLSSCLYTSGSMLGYKNKVNARLLRSWLFIFRRELFWDKLKKELMKGYNKCKKEKTKMAVRLNVYSDLPFESIDTGVDK